MKITNNQTSIYNHSSHKRNPPSFQGVELQLNPFFSDTKSKITILEAFDKNSYLMDFFKKNDVKISISEEYSKIWDSLNVFMDIKFRKLPQKEIVLTKPNAIQRLFGVKPKEQTVLINDSWKNINIERNTVQGKYFTSPIDIVKGIISSFNKENTIEQEYQRQLAEVQRKELENLKNEQKLKELSDKLLG